MAADTRRAILDATLDLLNAGDAGFTYERLAAHAGVARQTLYTHFANRTELLVAAVDHARQQLGGDALAAPVYGAATARDALASLLDFHVAFTPLILAPSRAVEAQRAAQAELSAAFEHRPSGRRQIVRHVVMRLRAEGDLAPYWSVDDAADLVSALLTASFTSDLLEERRWSTDTLRRHLQTVIERAILAPATDTPGDRP